MPNPSSPAPPPAGPQPRPVVTTVQDPRPRGGTPGEPAPVPVLEVVRGQAAQAQVRLLRVRNLIGRAGDVEVLLHDDAVSRTHAEVVFVDGVWRIVDLGSKNGVLVGGVRVPSAELKPGDHIVVGNTELAFVVGEIEISPADRRAALEHWDVLAKLKPEAKQELAACLRPRVVPRNGVVLRQGAVIEAAVLVHSGRLRLAEVNDEGGERVLGQLGPGDVFGERALLPGQMASCSLLADTPACLLELPLVSLTEFLQRAPESSQTVFLSVREKMRSAPIEAAAQLPARPDALAQPAGPTAVAILGEDRRVVAARARVEVLAKARTTPLLVGPAGVGKRTFARYYHQQGPSPSEPYLETSLAELEPAAVEGALFGHEADPRTPGSAARAGYLEMMASGTLVIVHAELMDSHVQVKLLRYLQAGWFHRVWGQLAVKSSTRIVLLAEGAEQEILARLVPELREEVKGNVIALPVLSSRLKDIPILAEHFLQLHARKAGKRIGSIGREAADKLVSYAWPGNLTELENVIQRAVIVTTEAELIPGDLIFVTPPEKEFHKLNLLRTEEIRDWLRKPWLFPALTWVNMAFVGAVALLTLYGGTRPPGHPLNVAETNPGMLVTWLVWFPLMPFGAALVGRVWCGICPIAGFGDLVARVRRLNLPVPGFLKSLGFWGLALAYFFVEYMEGAVEIDDTAKGTAIFLVGIIAAAVVMTVLFERRAFCKYLCPLAPWLGAYAAMAPLEIRGNKKVCQTQCGEHTCYKGTEKTPGCPMFLYPASMSSNVDCLLCTNCVRSCENRGVQLNLRPPLQELWRNSQPALAVSLFTLLLVGLMLNHQFTHIVFWKGLKATLTVPKTVYKPAMWVGMMLLCLIAFALTSVLSAAASREKVRDNMARYGLAFVPLAFAGHAAIMSEEVLGDGISKIVLYLKGFWQWLTADVPLVWNETLLQPFAHPAVITFIKFLLVSGGVTGTLVALVMCSRQASREGALARALPHLLLLLVLGGIYMWVFTAATSAPPAPTEVLGTPLPPP